MACSHTSPLITSPNTGGLEPEETAAGSGNADRAPAVAAMAHGHHAGGHGRGRPAAGPARRPPRIPRVPGGPKTPGLGGGQDAELGDVGLADHDQPRPAMAHD